jgi:hypothetical protein
LAFNSISVAVAAAGGVTLPIVGLAKGNKMNHQLEIQPTENGYANQKADLILRVKGVV